MNQTLLRSLLSALNERAGKDGILDVGAAWSAFEKIITCALYTAAYSAVPSYWVQAIDSLAK